MRKQLFLNKAEGSETLDRTLLLGNKEKINQSSGFGLVSSLQAKR